MKVLKALAFCFLLLVLTGCDLFSGKITTTTNSPTTETTTQITTLPTTLKPTTGITSDDSESITISFDANGGTAVSPVIVNPEQTFSLPGATKQGYQFTGWLLGNDPFVPNVTPLTEDVTLVATYQILEYTISYQNLEGTEASNVIKYTVETPSITLADPTSRTGYSFVGWFDSLTGGTEITAISLGSYGNITLYARWTPVQINITLHYNSEVINLQVNYGDTPLSLLTSYIKPEMVDLLLGWYTDLGFNNVIDITKPLTQNVELYPKFDDFYVVTFYNFEELNVQKVYNRGAYILTTDGNLYSSYSYDIYSQDSYYDLNENNWIYPYVNMNPLFDLAEGEYIVDVVDNFEDYILIVKTSLDRMLLFGYQLPDTLPTEKEYEDGSVLIDLEKCLPLNPSERIKSLLFSEMNIILSTTQARVFVYGIFGSKSNPTEFTEPFDVSSYFDLAEDEYFIRDYMTDMGNQNNYFRTNQGYYVFTDTYQVFCPEFISDDLFVKVDDLLSVPEKIIFFQLELRAGYIIVTASGHVIGNINSDSIDFYVGLLPTETILNLDANGVFYTSLGRLYRLNVYEDSDNLGEQYLHENEIVIATYDNDDQLILKTNQNRTFVIDYLGFNDITDLLAEHNLSVDDLVKCGRIYHFIKNGTFYYLDFDQIESISFDALVPTYAIYGENDSISLPSSAMNTYYLVDGWIDLDYQVYTTSDDLTGNVSLFPNPVEPVFIEINYVINDDTDSVHVAVGSTFHDDYLRYLIPYGYAFDSFELDGVSLGSEFTVLNSHENATFDVILTKCNMHTVTINYLDSEGNNYFIDEVDVVDGDNIYQSGYSFISLLSNTQKIEGLYTDIDLLNAFTDTSVIKSDITIYVHVVDKEYFTVTFITNGYGSGTVEALEGTFTYVDDLFRYQVASSLSLPTDWIVDGYYRDELLTSKITYYEGESNLTIYVVIREKAMYSITFVYDDDTSYTIQYKEGEFIILYNYQITETLKTAFNLPSNEFISGFYANADYSNSLSAFFARENKTVYVETYLVVPVALHFYDESGNFIKTINTSLESNDSLLYQIDYLIDYLLYGYQVSAISLADTFQTIIDGELNYDGYSTDIYIKVGELETVTVSLYLTIPNTTQVVIEQIEIVKGNQIDGNVLTYYEIYCDSQLYFDEEMTEPYDYDIIDEDINLYAYGYISKPLTLEVIFNSGIPAYSITHYSNNPIDNEDIVYYIETKTGNEIVNLKLFTDSGLTLPFTSDYIDQNTVLYASYQDFVPYTITLVSVDDVFEDYTFLIEYKGEWTTSNLYYSYLNRLIINEDVENIQMYYDELMTLPFEEEAFFENTTLYVKTNITDAIVLTAVYTNGTDLTYTQRFTFVSSDYAEIFDAENYWYLLGLNVANNYEVYYDSAFTDGYDYLEFYEDSTIYFRIVPRSVIEINYVFIDSVIPDFSVTYYDYVFFSEYTLQEKLLELDWFLPYYTVSFFTDLSMTDTLDYESYSKGTHTVYVLLEEVLPFDFEVDFIGIDIANHVFSAYPFENVYQMVEDYLREISDDDYGNFTMVMYVDSTFETLFGYQNFTEDYELYVFVLLPSEETFFVDYIFPELGNQVLTIPADANYILEDSYYLIRYYGGLNFDDFTFYNVPEFYSDAAFTNLVDPFTIVNGTVTEYYVKLSNETDVVITYAFYGDSSDVYYALVDNSYIIPENQIIHYFSYYHSQDIDYYYVYTDPELVTPFDDTTVPGNTILYVDVTFLE